MRLVHALQYFACVWIECHEGAVLEYSVDAGSIYIKCDTAAALVRRTHAPQPLVTLLGRVGCCILVDKGAVIKQLHFATNQPDSKHMLVLVWMKRDIECIRGQRNVHTGNAPTPTRTVANERARRRCT